MSAPITNSPISAVPEWRKRSNSSFADEPVMAKRAKLQNNYYFVLASESSRSEDEGSESVDSVQGKETDYCRDTSDTDTKSEMSDDFDMKVEYEIVSSSESENPFAIGSSSGEDALIAAGAVAASVVNESDLGIWCTEGDDDTESVSSVEFVSQTCKMCNMRNTVSCFPLCSHCYQIRKNCYPPRPKHKKKSKGLSALSHPDAVTTNKLSACLNVLSQDSGQGSSQDMLSGSLTSSQKLEKLAWDQVVVPENLILKSPEKISAFSINATASSCSTLTASTSSSVCDKPATEAANPFVAAHPTMDSWVTAASEMCIMCNESPKNGIFVHSSSGHMCCCYKCSVKYWSKSKRCAWCNLKANNVIKGFLV